MVDVAAAASAAVEVVDAGAAPKSGASRLSGRQKALYAIGDIADGLKNAALGAFLLIYLTGVLGLPGWLAGAASGIALIVDAVLDPLIGYVSDNTRSRWGRRHPYMLAAAIPFALGLGFIFSVPPIDTQWGLFAYALCVLLVLRVAFSVFVLPYAAIGAEVVRDYAERSVLLTYRNFFNICGQVLALTLGFSVFMSGEGGLLVRANYVPFGWTCAAIVFVAILVSTYTSRNLRHLMYDVAPPQRSAALRIFGEFVDVFSNRSFLVLFMTVLTFWVSQGAAAVLAVHALTYFWKLPAAVIQFIPLSTIVGNVFGIPLCAFLLRRMEKRDITAAGLGIFCVCQAVPATLAILGLMPEGTTLYLTLAAVGWIVGAVATCVLISFGSMMMDAADEHEFLFGVRREGLYFAGLVFSGKAAIGAGFIVAGVALDLIGFPQGIANDPNQVIPPETIRNLGLVAGPGAAAISLTSIFVLMRYRLLKRKLQGIQSELAGRRTA